MEEEVPPTQPTTEEPMEDYIPAWEHTECPVPEHPTLGHESLPDLHDDDQVKVHAPKGEIEDW